MSDDDNDFELEAAEEKRAHHNALERKRRDQIKNCFTSLRQSVPTLQGHKKTSRASVLKKAADYMLSMRSKNISHQRDIDELKQQNRILHSQIEMLEKSKATENYAMMTSELALDTSGSENSDTSDGELIQILKKEKVGQ